MYTKILLGMDASKKAKRAAEKVMEFQKEWDSKVVAFHSIEHHMISQEMPMPGPMEEPASYELPISAYNEIREAYLKRGKKVLDKTESIFQKGGLSVETRLIEDESPKEYITRITEEEDFDLVVLGCKGEHSKLEEVLLGTVAEAVVNNAPCDVLIVR